MLPFSFLGTFLCDGLIPPITRLDFRGFHLLHGGAGVLTT